MKTAHREITAVLRAGGSLVRWERAKTAHLLDADGRTLRRVRVFTLWDMTDAGVVVGRWAHEEGDCEDMVYELPTAARAD